MTEPGKSLMNEPTALTDAERAAMEEFRVAVQYMPPSFCRPFFSRRIFLTDEPLMMR